MKRNAIFILLGIASWMNAQLTDIRYIPSTSTDTISTKAQLYPSLLSKSKFNPVIFERGIKVGERRKDVLLRDSDIFYIEFVDKKGNQRVFKHIPELGLGNRLLEVMSLGKISWYRHYFDYKSDAWDQTTAYDDYFIKDKEIIKVPVKGKYKRKLKELVSDQNSLVTEVNRITNDRDIKEVIESYNKK